MTHDATVRLHAYTLTRLRALVYTRVGLATLPLLHRAVAACCRCFDFRDDRTRPPPPSSIPTPPPLHHPSACARLRPDSLPPNHHPPTRNNQPTTRPPTQNNQPSTRPPTQTNHGAAIPPSATAQRATFGWERSGASRWRCRPPTAPSRSGRWPSQVTFFLKLYIKLYTREHTRVRFDFAFPCPHTTRAPASPFGQVTCG